jgi:hypothetical protein
VPKGRSRSGVSSFANDPRVHGTSPAKRRPCGFTLLGCEAVVLDVRTNYRLRHRESQGVPFQASRTTRTQDGRSTVIHASESGESESLALANDPSRQATPLRQSAASCRVMHRRVPWRGVPLPRLEAFAAWPGERVLPSCVRPAALLGFLFCETLNTTGLRTSPKLLLARLMPTYLPWA